MIIRLFMIAMLVFMICIYDSQFATLIRCLLALNVALVGVLFERDRRNGEWF